MHQKQSPCLFLNGEERSSTEPLFTSHNRAFRYGDGLFESMRMIGGKLCFAQRHMQRLMSGVNLLQLHLPDNFVNKGLEEWCRKLAEKNNVATSARFRLSVFRNDGGYYHPIVNDASWLLEMWEVEEPEFMLNEKGITVELYQDIRKPVNKLSSLKTANAELYVLAALFAKKMNQQRARLDLSFSHLAVDGD